MGSTAQLPFTLAITKCFIDTLHLAPTDFMIRLPCALFGILTVPGIYLLGRQMAGCAFGLLLALWMAVNPFHIQWNREACFYFAICWAGFWSVISRSSQPDFIMANGDFKRGFSQRRILSLDILL
ncbi:MAG: glycosyltransferase family 39 protein [Kiritimatiellia bacterium]|nr:glycosyltransferase family 39 protein [Kiritimatiellia bacterium]